ncbi:MAG: hypothetical protein NT027_03525 [Proteobacteria bacterium]|nr:hypothetical protein [Pseudomonadota bacterium]
MDQSKENTKSQRNVKNLALQPALQMKFGFIHIGLSLCFAVAVIWLVFTNMNHLFKLLIDLAGVQQEISSLAVDYFEPIKIKILGLGVLYVAMTLLISLKLSHSLVGPTIAFRRHIKMIIEGDLTHRTKLRDGDAFSEVAEDLNQLSEHLNSLK